MKPIRKSLLAIHIACLLLMAFAGKASSQDVDAAAEKMRAERLAYMISSAESIDLQVTLAAHAEPVKAKLEGPVQRWSHAIGAKIPDAAVFVWTVDKRPVATAQIFYLQGFENWSQEFSSLTDEPLTAQQYGQEFWATKRARSSTIALEGQVAPREALRLAQMRAIARKFEATNQVDSESPDHLKLLPTPLYRYSSPAAGILDGALFSLASGTDPEVLLLVEAKQSNQQAAWSVRIAPMTIFACKVDHEGQEVWSMPFRLPPHAKDAPFLYHDDQSPQQPIPGQ